MTLEGLEKEIVVVVRREQRVLRGEIHTRPHRPVLATGAKVLRRGASLSRLHRRVGLHGFAGEIVFMLDLG